MAIQVDNSLHAAVTLVVTGTSANPTLAQSPQGCILERVDFSGQPAFLVQLDYPLDYASTSYEIHPYQSVDPATAFALPFVAQLLHITDRTKLLVLLSIFASEPTAIIAPFHLAITNYQANLEQLLPVQLVPAPMPTPQP